MKHTILATGAMLAPEMETLDATYDVIKLWKEPDPEATLHTRGSDIHAILSTFNGPSISLKMMEAMPNLEIITQFGVGYNNIDVAGAHARGIAVTNTPDVLTEDTADMAFALMLAVMRRVAEGDMFVRTSRWVSGADFPLGTSPRGKTAAIIGMGRIGQAIAHRCSAFGMEVVYHGPRKKDGISYNYEPNLIDCAKKADVLILSCVGGVATQNLINRAVLDALKPSAYVINIARGSVVDQDALVEKLVNRKIAGAGLDVFAAEPNVPEELKSLDNVVLTPHVASATLETRREIGQLVLDNLAAHFAGRPLLTPVV